MHTQQNKKSKDPRVCQGCFYGYFWFPVENREEPIKPVLCVCVLRIISETAPRIFLKPGMKLGVKNVRNVARPVFLDFGPFWRKPLIYAQKKPFLAIFGSFWAFEENPFRGFFLNPPKMCQQNSSKR